MTKLSSKNHYKKAKLTPQHHDSFELGALVVDDPYAKGEKVKALANIRHDVLIHWKSRKQIDEAQFIAGLKLQNIWYQSGIGMPSSIRYDRDRVDVSASAEPLADRVVAACDELRKVAAFLGQTDYRLATRILCEGRRIEDEAREIGGREPQLYVARRVRDALGYLAEHWGATGKSKAPMRAMTI